MEDRDQLADRGLNAAFALLAVGLTLALTLPWIAGRIDTPAGLEQDRFTARLDERIPQWMEADGVAGIAVALVTEGEEVWTQAYGLADEERNRPLTTESGMMAHSISKSVTAWGVMTLVDRGLIGLDDPVEDHLGGWRFPESDFDPDGVTVRRLLSHSAGLPLGSFGGEIGPSDPAPPLAEHLSGSEVRLQRPAGTAFAYSNSGYGVLELLVEEVTGRDFAAYMADEVLRPLGMARSSYDWQPSYSETLATGHGLEGMPVPPYRYPVQASGGLFSELGDLSRFVVASSGAPGGPAGAVLSPGALAILHAPAIRMEGLFGLVTDSYGLGHFVETTPSGHRVVWHGGQGRGWMTDFHLVPETGDGIVLLSNSQRSWPLIAQVLDEWARWNGLGGVGFARIAGVAVGLRLSIGLLLIITLWWAGRIGLDIRRGRRRLRLTTRPAGTIRIVEIFLGVGTLAILVWALRQDYLFITSVIPGETGWLAAGMVMLAVVLLSSALLPVTRRQAGAD